MTDFYCAAIKHVFEIDGQQHNAADQAERDQKRQSWLEEQGLTVIRIAASDVLRDPDDVANSIYQLCQTPSTITASAVMVPLPVAVRQGGETN